MLKREDTVRLLAELKARGFTAPPAPFQGNDSIAALGARRQDLLQKVADWVRIRGNDEETLNKFMEMFWFSAADLVEAAGNDEPASADELAPKVDCAAKATCLVEQWLSKMIQKYRGSIPEQEYIRLVLARADHAYILKDRSEAAVELQQMCKAVFFVLAIWVAVLSTVVSVSLCAAGISWTITLLFAAAWAWTSSFRKRTEQEYYEFMM